MEMELSVNFAKSTTVVVVVSLRAQMVHSLQSPLLNGAKLYTGSTVKNNKLLKHQQSNSHRQAVAEAEMCDQVEKRGSVFTQLHSASDRERSENLKILSKYVKVAYWLMRHEVAHTTNYESLIDLCTDLGGSDFLATWQNQRGENATYKSAATSTEMVKAIGQFLDETTVQEISSSPILRNRFQKPNRTFCMQEISYQGWV